MFRRPAHRRVLALLEGLDAELLARSGFLFGGGTRIALELDEYRESQDVDFLCSRAEGYSELRFRASQQGYPGTGSSQLGMKGERQEACPLYGTGISEPSKPPAPREWRRRAPARPCRTPPGRTKEPRDCASGPPPRRRGRRGPRRRPPAI